MVENKILDELAGNPHLYLTLSLSQSREGADKRELRQVRVSINDRSVSLEIPRMVQRRAARLLLDKNAIISAHLLLAAWKYRPEQTEDELTNILNGSARRIFASKSNGFCPQDDFEIIKSFGITQDIANGALKNATNSFHRLEELGLIIDPFSVDGYMFLVAGLIPLHFSIKTLDGEEAVRRMRLSAAMWSIEISKPVGRRADFDINIRGVDMIRHALTNVAKEYLRLERDADPRIRELRSPTEATLNDDDESNDGRTN